MIHRGPDDQGVYQNNDVLPGAALGHRRLSILDLSQAGRQPMTNEEGSLWIVFNGEIYNFQELRKDLLERGHKFSSATDTEAVLHL
jgi:asparagine synthase (glutamine-hydrolysing)